MKDITRSLMTRLPVCVAKREREQWQVYVMKNFYRATITQILIVTDVAIAASTFNSWNM